MKFLIASILVFTSSLSLANTINFSTTGESEYHSGIIQDDLDFFENALTKYLSNKLQCHSIMINTKVKSSSFFDDNKFAFAGSANCAGIVSAQMKIKIDSAGAGSVMAVKLYDQNNQAVVLKFKAPSSGE